MGQGERPALAHLAAPSTQLHHFQGIKLRDGWEGSVYRASTVDDRIKSEIENIQHLYGCQVMHTL